MDYIVISDPSRLLPTSRGVLLPIGSEHDEAFTWDPALCQQGGQSEWDTVHGDQDHLDFALAAAFEGFQVDLAGVLADVLAGVRIGCWFGTDSCEGGDETLVTNDGRDGCALVTGEAVFCPDDFSPDRGEQSGIGANVNFLASLNLIDALDVVDEQVVKVKAANVFAAGGKGSELFVFQSQNGHIESAGAKVKNKDVPVFSCFVPISDGSGCVGSSAIRTFL